MWNRGDFEHGYESSKTGEIELFVEGYVIRTEDAAQRDDVRADCVIRRPKKKTGAELAQTDSDRHFKNTCSVYLYICNLLVSFPDVLICCPAAKTRVKFKKKRSDIAGGCY